MNEEIIPKLGVLAGAYVVDILGENYFLGLQQKKFYFPGRQTRGNSLRFLGRDVLLVDFIFGCPFEPLLAAAFFSIFGISFTFLTTKSVIFFTSSFAPFSYQKLLCW